MLDFVTKHEFTGCYVTVNPILTRGRRDPMVDLPDMDLTHIFLHDVWTETADVDDAKGRIKVYEKADGHEGLF